MSLLLGLLALFSCRSTATTDPDRESGDLYISRPGDSVWISPHVKGRAFSGASVLPLELRIGSATRQRLASCAGQESAGQAYEAVMGAMLERFEAFRRREDRAGSAPTTLTIAARLTDRVTVEHLKNQPESVGADSAGRLARVALEVEFVDGRSGRIVAALVDVRNGVLFEQILRVPGETEVAVRAFEPLATRVLYALRVLDERSALWGNP